MHLTPTPRAGAWRDVAIGGAHGCGIHADGTLWCWGRNNRGQLGVGGRASALAPAQVGAASDWVAVAVGTAHSCAVNAGHQLWCWGRDDDGELLDGAGWRPTLARAATP